jgi:hypothetical protein
MSIIDMNNSNFAPAVFLAHAGLGRRIIEVKPKGTFFTQGDPADAVFYLRITAKRPPSRSVGPVILLERSPLPRRLECVWQPRLP